MCVCVCIVQLYPVGDPIGFTPFPNLEALMVQSQVIWTPPGCLAQGCKVQKQTFATPRYSYKL